MVMENNALVLKRKKIFVLDMDGTFYLGNKILDGSMRFIHKLIETNKEYMFFTNNSSKSSEFYIEKLHKMGCEISNKNIATSGDVTITYLKNKFKNKRVFLVGTEILEKSFEKAGINLVQEKPDVVVIGFDTTITYEKISNACTFIRNGCEFIATHLDINCPTEDGFIPDCGAMCKMIAASTGVEPKYLGKPFKETLDFVMERTGYEADDIVFVGDRLYTDIAIGFNYGVTSILVLSGETKMEDIAKSEIKPDFIYPNLSSIADLL